MFKARKIKTEQNGFNQKSKKKRSIWNIICACGISGITLGGSATAIYFCTTNYNLSSQYGKSYKLDTYTNDLNDTNKQNWLENPCIDPTILTSDLKNNALDNIKNNYSNYLANKKINDFDVDTKWTDNTKTKIELSATLPNEKYKDTNPSVDTNAKKKDQGLSNIYFDDVNSSRISLLYVHHGDKGSITYSSIITPEEYIGNDINVNKRVQLAKDSKNVYVYVGKKTGDLISDNLKKTGDTDEDAPKNEIYVIKDINQLVNNMIKDVEVCFWKDHSTKTFFEDKSHMDELYNSYWGMSNDERAFGNDLCKNIETNIDGTSDNISGVYNNFLISESVGNFFDASIQQQSLRFGNFYHYIDDTRDYDKNNANFLKWKSDTDSTWKPGTINNSDFFKKYVIGIIKSDNLSTYLPDKDPTSNNSKENNDNKWLVMGEGDLAKSTDIYKSYKKNKLDIPLYNFGLENPVYSNDPTNWSDLGVFGKVNDSLMKQQSPTFSGNWFKSSPIVASIIAIAAIIIVIGIIISVLYRIPWLFAFGCLLATLSLTLLIMLFGGFTFSFVLFAGLLAVFICSSFTILLFMERMKKQIKEGITTTVGLKKVIKNTIFQAIDIHFVNLLIAVCFIFMGSLDLNIMGMCMALGTLLSIVFVLCLWPLMCWLLFMRNYINIDLVMWKKIKQNSANKQPNPLQTTFSDNNWKIKFNIFNNISKVIVASIIATLTIVGIVLLATKSNNAIANMWSNNAIANYYLTSLYSWLVAIGLISLYGLIRLNWTSFIPLLVTMIVSFWLPFMIVAIAHIPLSDITSEYIVIMSLSFIINTSVAIIMTGSLNNSWVKTHLLDKKNLRSVLNLELDNSLIYVVEIISIAVGAMLLSLIISSTTLIWAYFIAIVYITIGTLSIYTILPWLMYHFIWWRYLYIGGTQRRLDGSIVRMNYDDVDEQEINEINKFKKVKATI